MPGRPLGGLWPLPAGPCAFLRQCPLPPKSPWGHEAERAEMARGAQPTPLPNPLPCPGGGLRLTGRVAGDSRTWFPWMVPLVKGVGDAQVSARWPWVTLPPQGPQTNGQHAAGPARQIPTLEPQVPESKARPDIQSLLGLTPSPSQRPTRTGTMLTFPRTPTTRPARLRPTCVPPGAPD